MRLHLKWIGYLFQWEANPKNVVERKRGNRSCCTKQFPMIFPAKFSLFVEHFTKRCIYLKEKQYAYRLAKWLRKSANKFQVSLNKEYQDIDNICLKHIVSHKSSQCSIHSSIQTSKLSNNTNTEVQSHQNYAQEKLVSNFWLLIRGTANGITFDTAGISR